MITLQFEHAHQAVEELRRLFPQLAGSVPIVARDAAGDELGDLRACLERLRAD